jgi:hypothetical protein
MTSRNTEGNPGSTDWQVAFPVIARNILLHYGELAVPVLREIWSALDLFMDYLERLIQKNPISQTNGLLLDGARGDWIPPEGNFKGPFPTPTPPISAFWHTLCVGYMAEIATAIERPADAARYTARLASNQEAYHAYFYNKLGDADRAAGADRVDGAGAKRCCYGTGSQTNNIFALHIGAVPPHLVNETVAMLVTSLYNRYATQPDLAGLPMLPALLEEPHSQEEGGGAVVRAAWVPDLTLPPHWIQPFPFPTPAFGPGAHMARCAFSDRNVHPRMPLDRTPSRLKRTCV